MALQAYEVSHDHNFNSMAMNSNYVLLPNDEPIMVYRIIIYQLCLCLFIYFVICYMPYAIENIRTNQFF